MSDFLLHFCINVSCVVIVIAGKTEYQLFHPTVWLYGIVKTLQKQVHGSRVLTGSLLNSSFEDLFSGTIMPWVGAIHQSICSGVLLYPILSSINNNWTSLLAHICPPGWTHTGYYFGRLKAILISWLSVSKRPQSSLLALSLSFIIVNSSS